MARREASLNSTAIASAAYDDDTAILSVTFVSGREYEFNAVPPDVYEELISSPSPGSYFHREIKSKYS